MFLVMFNAAIVCFAHMLCFARHPARGQLPPWPRRPNLGLFLIGPWTQPWFIFSGRVIFLFYFFVFVYGIVLSVPCSCSVAKLQLCFYISYYLDFAELQSYSQFFLSCQAIRIYWVVTAFAEKGWSLPDFWSSCWCQVGVYKWWYFVWSS